MTLVTAVPHHAAAWSDALLCVSESDEHKPALPNLTVELRRSAGFDENRNMCWSDAVVTPDGAADTPTNSSAADARRALAQADAFVAAGRISDAVLALRAVERMLPRVQDRIAMRRGELLRKANLPAQACEAFALALGSLDRGVAAQARIESVFCRLEAGDRKGESDLLRLLKSYPQLSQREALLFELAQARERWGNVKGAVSALRTIDLEQPGSPTAAQARTELARLADSGVRVSPYTDRERVERVDRMVRWAPIEQTTAALDELLADHKLSAELRGQTLLIAMRVARLQGRWQDMQDLAVRARQVGARGAELSRVTAAPAQGEDAAVEQAAVERQIHSLRGNKPIARVRNGALRALFELAIEHGRKDLCDETLEAMRTRRGFSPAVRFDSAIRATGLADDTKVAALLQTLLNVRHYQVSARYHYARALERLGQVADAEAEYTRVTASDRGATPYYAMWADLRLWAMRSETRETCIPQQTPILVRRADKPGAEGAADPSTLNAAQLATDSQSAAMPSGQALVSGLFGASGATNSQSLGGIGAVDSAAPRRERAVALLSPIAERYGDAFPWIRRAQDLVELELWSEAADELSETYLAWRDVKGALRMRSGLLALLTGRAPPRRSVTFGIARARRALDAQARADLSEAAKVVGDPGIALRFANSREGDRPRAYAELVENAARKWGLDPNLLFAVMRVESIYNRRIISNVGAVGLMQIMPGTGQRIAYQLGVENFDPTDLLDPQLNLDFSAWYLASLLKRFDGRLPLAIASYNGGPHNVRLWMRRAPANIPLDAFLERIPFEQTHRYVRRVLSYYAAYRAQQDLPMTRLSVELPELAPDEIAF